MQKHCISYVYKKYSGVIKIITYNGKLVFEGDIASGNSYRKDYLDSINRFIQKKYDESFALRDKFMERITEDQEEYRKDFINMIGQPVFLYPDYIPDAKSEFIGKDEFCNIYRLKIEVMPEFWFYGIFMIPHGINRAPLVIAQHGGGSTPEICSEFLGKSNYNFFTKRALEKGMAVFAPQLLLWKFDIDTGEQKTDIDIHFNRGEIDGKLKHIGLSITGLEVFCIRRSVDYINSLDYIDENRTAMMGLSYGGYFSLYTAAADKRIKSIYAAGFFNDRTKIVFGDWRYKNSANTFCDPEIIALCAPRRLQIDVGKTDSVFDYVPSVEEGKRAAQFYTQFNAEDNFRFNLWDGGHRFDESGTGFDFFFDEI